MNNTVEKSNSPSSAKLSSKNNQAEEKKPILKRKRKPSRAKDWKKYCIKRLRANTDRPVIKSPLMVFDELFGDKIPIRLLTTKNETITYYTALIEVDGCVFKGEHVYRVQAKEIACENYLRYLFMNKLDEKPAKSSNDKRQGDFPWMLFISLAMYNLMINWKVGSDRINACINEDYTGKPVMPWEKPFPPDADKRNPVEVLHQLIPSIYYHERSLKKKRYECNCKLYGMSFTSAALRSKNEAREDCAIKIIKEFWGYDYNKARKV